MINVKLGDFFTTKNPMALGIAINAVQKVWSRDNRSEYSHAGIITSDLGDTLEALWTVKNQNLFEAYAGENVLVARYTGHPWTLEFKAETAIYKLRKKHEGQVYPIWRLPFQLIPPLAKYLTWRGKFCVCSELVAEYLHMIGARHDQFMGTNPDTLADEWHRWKDFEIIHEGILPSSPNW